MGIYTIPIATAEYVAGKNGIWHYDFYLDWRFSDTPRGRFELDSTTWQYKLSRLPHYNAISYQVKEILELFVARIQSASVYEQPPKSVRLMLSEQTRRVSALPRRTGS